jgi:hypothetical protein
LWIKFFFHGFNVDLIVIKCEDRSFSVRKDLAIGFRDEDRIIERFVFCRFIIIVFGAIRVR